MVQEIDVGGVARFSNFWFAMALVVVVGMDLNHNLRSRRFHEPEDFLPTI